MAYRFQEISKKKSKTISCTLKDSIGTVACPLRPIYEFSGMTEVTIRNMGFTGVVPIALMPLLFGQHGMPWLEM